MGEMNLEMDPRAWPGFIKRLKDHVGEDAGPELLREALGQVRKPPNLGTALFGSITWPKDLGRPDVSDAALGFRIASISRIAAFQTAEGTVYAPWTELVAAWEVIDPDPDRYRVTIATSYTTSGKPPDDSTVLSAQFSSVPWIGGGRLPQRIEPKWGFRVVQHDGGPKIAPPLHVYTRARVYTHDLIDI